MKKKIPQPKTLKLRDVIDWLRTADPLLMRAVHVFMELRMLAHAAGAEIPPYSVFEKAMKARAKKSAKKK